MKITSTHKTIAHLMSSSILAAAVGIIGTLIQTIYVEPESIGFLRSHTIIASYCSILLLGTIDSYQRLYPLYIGSGNYKKAKNIEETVKSWSILLTFISIIITFNLMIFSTIKHQWMSTLAWCSLMVALITLFYGSFLNATFRSKSEFNVISNSTIKSSFVSLAATPIMIYSPYIGLIIRSISGPIYNILDLQFKNKNYQSRINYSHTEINIKEIRTNFIELVSSGLPIFIATYGATSLWLVIETTLVMTNSSLRTLGLYTFTITVIEIGSRIPNSITSYYHPKVMELYGKSKSDYQAIKLLIRPTIASTLISLLLLIIIHFFLDKLIIYIFPNYIDSIILIKITSFSILFLSLELPYSLLIARASTISQNMIVYASLIIFFIMASIAIKLDYGFIGILYASAFSKLLRVILIYLALFSIFLGSDKCNSHASC